LNMLKEAANNKDLKSNSDEGKAVNLYKTYLDTIKRTELGIKPIEADLAKINAIKNLTDVNNLVQSTIMQGGTGLFGMYVSADALDSNKNVIYIYGTATGLGERDYYLLKDAETTEIRNRYEKQVA